MSDDPDTCHLPSCDAPLQTETLCSYHASRLLAPLPVKRPRPQPVERQKAA